MSENIRNEQEHVIGDTVKSEIEDSVYLEGTVSVSGKDKQLKLMQNGLTLGGATVGASNKKVKALSLIWRDVICAVRDVKASGNSQLLSFTIHYIEHLNNKLQVQNVKITVKDGQPDRWVDSINEKCQKVSGRPKKAFVFVNPIGGAKRGQQIYKKTVGPLFELAGMHITVAVTERSKHALELSEHQDFSSYDTIVIIGGDGLYQEVLQGLILKLQKEAGVDYDNPDSIFSKPDITFGIIPAGTGNGMSGWCNGIIDQATAALNIIRGESQRTMVFTVHSCGKFVTLCGVVFGYGEWSDMVKQTDELRWMGRMRYPYAMIGMLLKKPRMFNCTVEYRVADTQKRQDGDVSSGTAEAQGAEWTVWQGNSGEICGILALASERVVRENSIILNPYGNSVDLLFDFGCGRLDLMKTLMQFMTGKISAEPLPAKLELISGITGFRIKVTQEEGENGSATRNRNRELEHFMDIDGEVVHVDKVELDIRVRSNFVPVYGRQIVPDAATAV